jgi:lysine 2,3-aminomutase
LLRALHGRTSGLCQPTYVLDIPGGHGKSPIGPNYLSADGAVIEDYCGRRHAYAATASAAAAAEKNTVVSNA